MAFVCGLEASLLLSWITNVFFFFQEAIIFSQSECIPYILQFVAVAEECEESCKMERFILFIVSNILYTPLYLHKPV